MKKLVVALFVFASAQAFASAQLSYVCGSQTASDSSALVLTDGTTHLEFFVQKYQNTSPINLLGTGTLNAAASTSSTLVFDQLTDGNGSPLNPLKASSVEVSVANDVVTSIKLNRAAPTGLLPSLIYNRGCIVDDASR